MSAATNRALSALAKMRPRIEKQRQELDADVAYRDACIIVLVQAGWSERAVAELAGISAARVHQIKEEHEAL